jgi:hypothetical protein
MPPISSPGELILDSPGKEPSTYAREEAGLWYDPGAPGRGFPG